jgi:hypothetical protein
MNEIAFTDAKIRERLAEWRNAGRAEQDGEKLARHILVYAEGECAADALEEVLENLGEAALERLVVRHSLPEGCGLPIPNDLPDFAIVEELGRRGFSVQDTSVEGWVVTGPTGLRLTAQYRGLDVNVDWMTLPSRQTAICRLALRSAWHAGQTKRSWKGR